MTHEEAALPSDQLLDALEVAVVVFRRDGTMQIANRHAREMVTMLGASPDDVGNLFERGFELLDEHGRPVAPEELPSAHTFRTGEGRESIVMGVRSPARSGTIWFTVDTKALHGADGEFAGVACSFVEITAQRDAEDRLRASEERFRTIAENAGDVIYRFAVTPSPRVEYVNPVVESVLGYSPQEFYDDPNLMVKVTHEEDVERVRVLGLQGIGEGELVELRMTRRDGTMLWTAHRMMALRDPDGQITGIAGIARDVTALKAKEEYLSHQALHDPLTGLPNRILLLERLEAELARQRRHDSSLAVLYLDLDRFKAVNDNLGHDAGDRLLHVVAQRLQETLRPSDSVARLGGDEFAAVLGDLRDAIEASVVAERILAAVAAPVDLGRGSVVVTVSVGIAAAASGDDQVTAPELLRRADLAMYAAKDRGRSRVERYSEQVLGAGVHGARSGRG